MLSKLIKNFIKQFFLQTPSTLIFNKKKFEKKFKSFQYLDGEGKTNNVKEYINNFGEINKDKIFYVIKRSPGTGLFSNVTFVLNHLIVSKKFGFIPIVDMENFITIYNEQKPIKSISNSWEYYFKNLSNYTLEEVYRSNKVIVTNDKFYNIFKYSLINDLDLKNLFKSEIFINDKLKNLINFIKKKHFIDKKILGVHFRGTSYKQSPGHPFPATKKQMINLVNKILQKYKIDMIFLSTEEEQYLDLFKKVYGNKVFYLESPYRSNKNDAFKVYPRKNHRYKLGREILIETFLLSQSDHFIYVNSNVSSAAMALNINKDQKRYDIKNGFNSKNQLTSQWLWYLKKNLPKFLGGFDNNLNLD